MRRGHGKMKLVSIASHRNGVGGNPFTVAIAKEYTGDSKGRKMIVQFDGDTMSTAVFDLDKLTTGDIAFGSNSWRGDMYADWMKEQCKKNGE